MRQLLSSVVTALCAIGATACGPSSASTSGPVPSGEFRVLVPDRPSTLNPNLHLDEMSLLVGRSLFSQLLTLNESGRLLPELAESWTVSQDGRVYTFRLRENVRWHDGTTLSAADVKWTLETMAREGFGGRDALAPVESIEAPDDRTIVITLQFPWAPFASDLAGPGLAILPRHVYGSGDWRKHPANDHPIGSGPFKFGRWRDGNTLVLDANTDYFRSGPYVQSVVFEVVTPDTVTARLMRGDADYSIVRPVGIDPFAPPASLVARTLPTSARYYLAFNLRHPVFSDVRVRRAMAMALDRLEIVSVGLQGLGAPAVGWYTPDVEWAYNSAARVPEFDRRAAERLLKDAGQVERNGARVTGTLLVPNAPHLVAIAEEVRAQFATVGVRIVVASVPPSEWARRVIVDHDFDLVIASGNQGPDPDQLRRRFLATETGAFIGYDSVDFREAVERGARMVSVAERAAAYHRAQEVLARDIPFIPLAEAIKVVVHNARVTGMPQLEARGLVGMFDFSLLKIGTRPATTR